jgi:hypothetical protein
MQRKAVHRVQARKAAQHWQQMFGAALEKGELPVGWSELIDLAKG